MKDSTRKGLAGRLKSLAESAWFAYLSIALLQVKVMLWIWEYRDLVPGDIPSYYMNAFRWLDEGQSNIILSPAYTLFLAALHRVIEDPFRVLIFAQIAIATSASLLTLALMRRLLANHIAWLVAAWWAVLSINFDTIYSVHLFSALFPLAIFLIAARIDSIYGRGIVLAGLLLSAALVRLEYGALFVLWLLLFASYEFYAYLKKQSRHSPGTLLVAYGAPLLLVFLVLGFIYTKSIYRYDEIVKHLEFKQTLNVGQVYAFNRRQQGDPWQGNYWTEYQSLMERDFGQPEMTFSQAMRLNPRAMLGHFWWNIKLIPSGTQLALFSHYAGGPNPDYIRARQSPLVWAPFLAVLGLCLFAAASVLIKRRSTGNAFPWLLMLSAALLVVGLMITQRPRPSYMFPYTTFLMALTGLGLQRLLQSMRTDLLASYWPLAGIPIILFVPFYYDEEYTNHYGYKGQPLLESYERFAPLIDRTDFDSPAVLLTPEGDYEILCDYFGVTCFEMEMESRDAVERMPELIADYMDGQQVKNVYVLYLDEMISTFTPTTGQETGDSMGYVELNCFSRLNDVITCSDGTIDLNRGVMNDGSVDIPLRAALFVNDGYVVARKDFAVEHGYYLQIVMKQNKVNMILVADEPLFRSNFNQQYLLGNYDRHTFSETYNESPVVRILQVK
ncbi:hypothetical protein [Desulfuromonas sp. TF]|uniref:hypothetical protein n=1 Tax=Desulfuromonas sp. TF TaxID=1232410 RepID=UPI0004084721|nr:hypothetical protein [Desulfuromonas sp. TF]